MYTAVNQYKKIMVQTASPLENIILLYNKCIQQVTWATRCLANNDPRGKGQAILKAIDIINALDGGLDHDEGEVAQHLHNSYQAILLHLTRANVQNDATALNMVVDWLTQLAESWQNLQVE